MFETTTFLGALVYGLVGLGAGRLLSHLYRWLARAHEPSTTSEVNKERFAGWLVPITGLGFAGVWLKHGLSAETLITSAFFCIFALIFALDVAYRWIPNVLLLPSAGLALLVSALTGHPSVTEALLGGLVGFGWFYLIALVTRGALGAGDVKLAGLIGLITGFPNVLTALTVGIVIGGIIAALLLISGQTTRKSYIPYAPFLIAGTWTTWLFGAKISIHLTRLVG